MFFFFGLLFSLNSCQSVQEGLAGGKKNNEDEFLVQKKNPLVMPPAYSELPSPGSKKIQTGNNDNKIKKLLGVVENEEASDTNSSADKSLEDSITKILNEK